VSVEAFLAVLATRRAPRTVDAYRRDLTAFAEWLGAEPSDASTDDIERYLAEGRAAGLSGATLARRLAAIRSYFRHEQLIGARTDNPAAALAPPRRVRRLPRTLSPGEAERLIDAAAGTTPRALRDQALVELLYGAGLRVSEAVGLDRTGVDLDERFVRCIGKGDKERVVPIGRRAAEALRRYLSRGRPYLDRRHRPDLFLNAQGGALTRAGAFLILRRLAGKAGLDPEHVHPTCCGIRSPRTCSRAAPTCARCRRCSATPISRRRSCTRTSATLGEGACTSTRTPTPGAAGFRKDLPVRKNRVMGLDPHLAGLVVATSCVGLCMALAGVGKNALEWRRRERSCPSCGRRVRDCRCWR